MLHHVIQLCSSVVNPSKAMELKRVCTYLFDSFGLHKSKFSVLICYIQGKFHIGVTAKEEIRFNGLQWYSQRALQKEFVI